MKKILILAISLCLLVLPAFSQAVTDLLIGPDDLYILPGNENGTSDEGTGYHLYIRKKPGLESVMLVESAKDPDGKQTNYAYRAKEYNKINGDEKRFLNGKLLESETSKYSLIDSTSEKNSRFGEAFHIYIPETIIFGYSWARSGEVKVADGFFVNIRTFSKKYGDYTGNFSDNSFAISKRKKSEKKSVKPAAKSAKTEKPAEKTVKESVKAAEKSVVPEPEMQTDIEETENQDQAEENTIVSNFDVELDEQIAAVPFEEEELSYDENDQETEEEPEADDETPGLKLPEIPSENPFVEDDAYYVEEIEEPEPEIQEPEIPEDERDPVAETLFNEAEQTYDPAKLGKEIDVFDELKVEERKPAFKESMEGVDPDFVKKLEAEEEFKRKLAEAEAEAAKYEEEPVYERPYLGDRFITHDIEMIKVEGSGRIKTLYISKTEVTQRSYMEVMGINPSKIQGDFFPVESVSWYDVIVFCNLMSMRDGLVPCYTIKGARNPGSWGPIPKESKAAWNAVECDYNADGYRMLTVEEWEYAAQGGIYKNKTNYAGSNIIDEVGWYKDNSEETTHPVGYRYQNSCGLYDMTGNVSEWCMGFTGNAERSAPVRGGNYTYDKKTCKISFKDACQPWYPHFENGIRICRNAE